MADADVLDIIGLEADLRQLGYDAHFRRDFGRCHGMAGVPQKVLVAMFDEVAAVDELKLEVAVREGVGETLVHCRRRLGRAAVETGKRHVWRRLCRRVYANE